MRHHLMPWLFAAGLLAVVTIPTSAEDRRSVPHHDRQGFDYYDAAWSFLGLSRLNHLGSYDFFDRFNRKVGWADATRPGQINFYLANGELLRTVLVDAAGGSITLDAYGNVKVIGSSNVRGGYDYFSPFNFNLTSATTTLEYQAFTEAQDGE